MVKKSKNNKGITLMVLIITVIIMLILAAVSIYTLTGDNGILKKSRNAKDLEKNAATVERINEIFRTKALDIGDGSSSEYISAIMKGNNNEISDIKEKDGILAVQWKDDGKWYRVENINGLYKVTDVNTDVDYTFASASSVKISFDTNGGQVTDPIFLTSGYEIGTLPRPIKVGYSFDGWYTEKEEDKGELVTATTKVPNADTTYYAHWIINVAATDGISVDLDETEFDYDGQEHRPGVIVKYNDEDVDPTNFEVKYDDDVVNVGEKNVVVTLSGYYGGTVPKTYVIKKVDAVNPDIEAYSGTYDGKAHTVTVSGGSGGTIFYSTNAENWSENKPSQTNAGTTTVYVKVVGDSNHNDTSSVSSTITISKANAVNPTVTAYSGTYDGKAHTVTVSGGSGGTIQYSTNNSSWSTTKPTQTNVGTTTVYVRVAGDSNHNTTSSTSKTITISKANAVNPTVTAYSGTYDGKAHTVGVSGGSGGTVQYSTNNSSWSTTKPTLTNAGSITVYVRVAGDANHNTTGSTSKKVTISKANAVNPTVTAYSGTYDGKAHTVTVSGGSGGTIQYSTNNSSWSTTKPTRTDAGTTTVYIRVAGDANHNTTGSFSRNIAIARARTATYTATNKTYNGSQQTGVTGTNVTFGGTISARDVGSYSFTVTPDKNHAWSDGGTGARSGSWSITRPSGYDGRLVINDPNYSGAPDFIQNGGSSSGYGGDSSGNGGSNEWGLITGSSNLMYNGTEVTPEQAQQILSDQNNALLRNAGIIP